MPSARSTLVDIEVELRLDDPAKAAILVSGDGTITCWLPRSQIEYEVTSPGHATVTMPQWLAEERDLV